MLDNEKIVKNKDQESYITTMEVFIMGNFVVMSLTDMDV